MLRTYSEKGSLIFDAYCRRRALISLARLHPHDAQQLAEQFLHDTDPYMRLGIYHMIQATLHAEFIARARRDLLHDKVEYVRKAAQDWVDFLA